MLDTLICLLQEESERLAGRALPEEICRMILIEHGGMVSPSAMVWHRRGLGADCKLHRIATAWTTVNAVMRALVAANDEEFLASVSEYTIEGACTIDDAPCAWNVSCCVPEWATVSWVMDELKEANPHWPYKSRRAKLDNILRGDKAIAIGDGGLRENWPVYCRQVRLKTIRHGPYVYKGPCLRCQAPCIFEMGGICKANVDSDAAVHMRFHCMHGHEEQHLVQDTTKAHDYLTALGIRFGD